MAKIPSANREIRIANGVAAPTIGQARVMVARLKLEFLLTGVWRRFASRPSALAEQLKKSARFVEKILMTMSKWTVVLEFAECRSPTAAGCMEHCLAPSGAPLSVRNIDRVLIVPT